MGRVKGSGEGARSEKRIFLPSPSPFPLSFFRPRTYRKGYYFYSPQSSTVIKSKMAVTTILQTRTRFCPPKIRLHDRLHSSQHCWSNNVGTCCVRVGSGVNGCNNSQQHATCNNMQQGVQTEATCNIQQCCVRLHGD